MVKDTKNIYISEKESIDLNKIYNNYGFYLKKAEENRKIVEERWTWKESCNQLLKALNYEEKTK